MDDLRQMDPNKAARIAALKFEMVCIGCEIVRMLREHEHDEQTAEAFRQESLEMRGQRHVLSDHAEQIMDPEACAQVVATLERMFARPDMAERMARLSAHDPRFRINLGSGTP